MNVRRALAISGALATIAGLAACDPATPTHGTVIAKIVVPPWVETVAVPIYMERCQTINNQSVCHQVQIGTNQLTKHHEQCNQLTVKDPKGATGKVCVDAAEYAKSKVGDTR